jgi:hypothetical protein
VGNTDRSRYVGGYRIPNPLESDREYARYHGDDLAKMTLPALRVERRRVELALARRGNRLDPTEPDLCWLEQRWKLVREEVMREEAALRLAERGSE